MESWPNFFIVGAPKCGTSSLYEYLKDVPEVFMCPVKEPNYFGISVNTDFLLSKPIRDKKKYLNLFSKIKKEIAIGEATPSYLWDPKAPELIYKQVPNAKIIIILRDPIERAYSEYLFHIGLGYWDINFSDLIRNIRTAKHYASDGILGVGLYYEQILRYKKIFGLKKIKFLIFEEFVKNPNKSVNDVLEFLGIKTKPYESKNETYNPYSVPRGTLSKSIIGNSFLRKIGKEILPFNTSIFLRKILTEKGSKPPLDQNDRNFLEDFYHEDVKKLKELLNFPIPWPIANKE